MIIVMWWWWWSFRSYSIWYYNNNRNKCINPTWEIRCMYMYFLRREFIQTVFEKRYGEDWRLWPEKRKMRWGKCLIHSRFVVASFVIFIIIIIITTVLWTFYNHRGCDIMNTYDDDHHHCNHTSSSAADNIISISHIRKFTRWFNGMVLQICNKQHKCYFYAASDLIYVFQNNIIISKFLHVISWNM